MVSLSFVGGGGGGLLGSGTTVCEVHDGSLSGAAAVPSVVSWCACAGKVQGLQLVGIDQRLFSAAKTISFAPTNTGFEKAVVGELGSDRSSVPVWFALAEKSHSAE